MKQPLFFIFSFFLSFNAIAQQNASVNFEEWISLKTAGAVTISPDGKTVAYTITTTDWENNNYDTEVWLCRIGEQPFQLTRTPKGSSSSPRFTADSKWVSFLADRGEKTQIYLAAVAGGEAFPITKDEDGVNNYLWSNNGQWIAYTKADQDSKKDKTRKERYGAFGVEGEEYKQNHLWLLSFNLDSILNAGRTPCYTSKTDSSRNKPCFTFPKAKRLTEGDFNVAGFRFSPDGKQIAFTRQPSSLINDFNYSDVAIIDIASKKIKVLVNNPAADFIIDWSPDGKQFVYGSYVEDSVSQYYKNNRVFIYDTTSKKSREILADFDENKNIIEWNVKGIYFNASQKTKGNIYQFNPLANKFQLLTTGFDIANGISFSKDGLAMAITGRSYNGLSEITVIANNKTQSITNMTQQISNWNTPINEVIQWKSKDGEEIEGVLLKPRNYDPTKKYPLLCVIHGGPTGTDRPEPTPSYVYPIMQWCEKGALVLRVNYRGSAGYGEKFRSLNVRNLGVGDMWDVMSGIDFLSNKGMIDTARMGCMGWSQGGYISAFLTTNTNRFKAISVGAGISNWMTYYVNTDITPFTLQYLQSTPWSDPEMYAKTSPITNINKASTPTLIQHGEFDKRVPIPNAYELYRGLQDRKIPSKLIVYKGFGHGITKPKERLAAVWHNWQWFNHYVFGEKMEEMIVE
jgi:dipeptidyl aminopeptidase/acylaminoacyl peptidase